MPVNIIKKTKTILTNPIYSKTIYPFSIDRKIIEYGGTEFMDVGRLFKTIKQDSYLEGDLIFQCATLNSRLQIKYDVSLYNGIYIYPIIETFIVEKNFLGNVVKKFIFPNTNTNTEMRIAVSALNETQVPAVFANKINLVYLEIKEE